jgi:hypothetical protein
MMHGLPIGGFVFGGQLTRGDVVAPGSVLATRTQPGPVLISRASKRPLPAAEPTGVKSACKRTAIAGTRTGTELDRAAPAVTTITANTTTAASESAPLTCIALLM